LRDRTLTLSLRHPLLATTLVAATACHVSLNDPGTDPQAAQFYFPAGIAKDPELPYLYITNANSDLKYGGGTVQVADLSRFACAVERFRNGPSDELAARCPKAEVDSASCSWDPLDPTVVNCDETPFILGDSTVKVGNFAGNLLVQRTGLYTRRLFVSVRGDPSITWIDVDLTLATTEHPRVLDCFDPATRDAAAGRAPLDPTHNQPPPLGCDVSHLLQTFVCVGAPGCTAGNNVLPPEPFGLALDQGKLSDGSPYSRLLVAHQQTGQVSLVDTLAGPFVVSVSQPFFASDQSGRRGAFALAPQFPGRNDTPWYMTSTITPRIDTFRVADVGVIVPSITIPLVGLFATGVDVRQIVFEAGGQRAFISQGNPPAVLVMDTRTLPQMGQPAAPVNQIVDVVPVCQGASTLVARPTVVKGAPGEPDFTQTRLYVVCFQTGQVVEIDPDLARINDTILVGRGPNQVVFDDTPDLVPSQRAWVNNFLESSIGLIDLVPGSLTEKRMIARLGNPVPPKNP
jgi:DNA-binding beta-propeller fold protein YncE